MSGSEQVEAQKSWAKVEADAVVALGWSEPNWVRDPILLPIVYILSESETEFGGRRQGVLAHVRRRGHEPWAWAWA